MSLPLFQFLLCRWYFRLFIWARFLLQVSRIELSIWFPRTRIASAGSGFLSNTVYAFTVLARRARRHGCRRSSPTASSSSAPRCVDYKVEIAVMVAFLLCVVFGPLLVFAPQLAAREADGPSRVRHAGGALRARVRCQVAAGRRACRRAARRQLPTSSRSPI